MLLINCNDITPSRRLLIFITKIATLFLRNHINFLWYRGKSGVNSYGWIFAKICGVCFDFLARIAIANKKTFFWCWRLGKNFLKLTVGNIEASTQYMDAITKGWLMAKQAKPLFGINWNQLWEHLLEEIRADLNIVFPTI